MMAMPSSSALCASMAPRTTSPMAKMPGTLVVKWSSTSTMPRAPTLMPTFSRPSPSVKGTRPVASSTMSASIVTASPPLTGSTVSVAPPAGLSAAPMTLVDILNFMPCFLSTLWKVVAISESRPGVMWSRNSTTVTSVPSRRQTEPISRPMTPAPMTIIFLGISFRSSAPVEVVMIFSSTGTPGSEAGTEPVAMTMFLVSRVWTSPSRPLTLTAPALRISPVPLK
mmetsp:Transcript_21416/g.50785  ORF Transcript_21416/g.50785 Transcript_21416/m.50785 type:complete len:225 (+) Transcript_21416:572-1246(+)